MEASGYHALHKLFLGHAAKVFFFILDTSDNNFFHYTTIRAVCIIKNIASLKHVDKSLPRKKERKDSIHQQREHVDNVFRP